MPNERKPKALLSMEMFEAENGNYDIEYTSVGEVDDTLVLLVYLINGLLRKGISIPLLLATVMSAFDNKEIEKSHKAKVELLLDKKTSEELGL